MRIFFIGTVQFSYHCLELLLRTGINVVGVATKQSSKFNSDFADLSVLCEKYKVPYQFILDINAPESLAFIRDKRPDVLYCFGWSNLIKNELINMTPLGVIGYHPAALPHNRGRHPIIWALVLGLSKTASTFFFMDEGADTGDILSQKEVLIDPNDDAQSLYEKLTTTGLQQMIQFTKELEQGIYQRIPQNKQLGNYWRKRNVADGKIDFRMCSKAIYNLVRGLARPYVGAHIEYSNSIVKVWKVIVVEDFQKNIEPGKILSIEGKSIKVKTIDGAILLTHHEFTILPKSGEYL
jgi:methionyl-tRNA formyltransferase